MSNKIDLKELFHGLQNQMTAQLNTNRKFIMHSGSKGDALENTWIEWMRNYLPDRYSVDKAIVIDSEGCTSHQIDVVIYDSWFTPFILKQNGFNYIPAEGVYAVFEVKPDIQGNVENQSYIEYAGDKIESVRSLKRTTTKIINAGRDSPARPLTKIVGGILTSSNSYTHDNNNTIEKHLKKLSGYKTLDFGCIADYGSFYVDYTGKEDSQESDYAFRFTKYYRERQFNKLVFSESSNSMVSFFLQLTKYLQQSIGTVAAIDLNAYSKAINFLIDEEI